MLLGGYRMLTDKLFDFDFYKNSMSLFLRNSPGMTERVKILFDILLNVRDSQYKVFDLSLIHI